MRLVPLPINRIEVRYRATPELPPRVAASLGADSRVDSLSERPSWSHWPNLRSPFHGLHVHRPIVHDQRTGEHVGVARGGQTRLSHHDPGLVQLGDAFDEIIHNVGGTKGPQPGVYVITGLDFTGQVLGETIRVASRTKFGAVGVRVFANGEADLPTAVEVQQGFHLMPLSAYLRDGLAYKPSGPGTLDAMPNVRFD
jgi:hypothetical protein